MSESAIGSCLPRSNGAYKNAEDEIDRLKADIAIRRQRVVVSVGELRRRVDGIIDWRHWVDEYPLRSIGVAIAVGFILGGGGNRRRIASGSR